MSSTRNYELKRRAERQDETRRRIVDAAVELHSTLGPSRTTVKAIAERAGVTRPTVYAHFPDDQSLFLACSSHVRDTVPPPDPAGWSSIADPEARLRTALAELYGYYARQEQLLDNVERDARVMPLIAELNGHRLQYLDDVRETLLDAWPPPRRKATAPAIGHALEFSTWQSLVRRQQRTTDEAVRLMLGMAEAAGRTAAA